MHYVYRIQSETRPDKSYTGYSQDLKERLAKHNCGGVSSTKRYKPWKLVFYAAFEEKEVAFRFERYLKSGSGVAFGKKRLWPEST